MKKQSNLFVWILFVLAVLCVWAFLGCRKNEDAAASRARARNYINLADGTHNWMINVDTYGSSVENFENAENSLKFTLFRAEENAEAEQWSWSEILYDAPENVNWSAFSTIDINYTAQKELTIILSDSELEKYNPAAGFWAVLPPSEDTTITLVLQDLQDFRQHDWVISNFPDIRKSIDNSKLYGIKIGTRAVGEANEAVIKSFVLNGVVAK